MVLVYMLMVLLQTVYCLSALFVVYSFMALSINKVIVSQGSAGMNRSVYQIHQFVLRKWMVCIECCALSVQGLELLLVHWSRFGLPDPLPVVGSNLYISRRI